MRIDPSSKVNWTKLDNREISKRAKRGGIIRKIYAARVKRLKKKLVETKIEVKLSSSMYEELQQQLRAVKENPSKLRSDVLAYVKETIANESTGGHDRDSLISDDDTTAIVDFVIEALNNHVIKKVGKNNYSFSPYLMGLAMDQHLQGKTTYHRLQERCVFVLPSGNSLRKKVQQQGVSDGDGIDLYERIMMHMNTDEIIGQIMCDEMKLKGDIAMCVHSNQLRGFTKDFADSKKSSTH